MNRQNSVGECAAYVYSDAKSGFGVILFFLIIHEFTLNPHVRAFCM